MLIPERYRTQYEEGIKKSRGKGKYKYCGKRRKITGLKKDGSEFPIEISFSLWKNNGNIFFINIVRDVMERKRLLEELKEERDLFVGGPVVVFKWKAGEKHIPVEYVSQNVEKVLGYNTKDFIDGKIKYDDIIHPDDLERVLKEAELYRKKGLSSYEQEYRIIDAKGNIRWIHDFTLIKKNEDGEITHYHGYIVDITQRKKIWEELEKERKQLISVFNGIDEPLYITDPKTYEILFANKTIKQLFGKNIIGKKCYKVFQNLNKPCDFCTNDKILGKNFGKVFVWEFQNKKNKRWYRCIDRGIIWPDGRKVRMEIAIDVTDRIKAEEKIRKTLEKEREFKLRTAHFFFNPIAIAKGYLHLALEGDDVLPKIEKAIDAIERIEKVVRNITQQGKITE